MDEQEFITLETDDGDIECEVMGTFEVNDKEYIALVPQDESDDVYLYGYHEVDEENFELIDIEDDAEFEAVAAEFDRLMNED